MAATFTIAAILAATRGNLIQRGGWDTFYGVSTDSRTTQTGQMFIPLSGERHDGHDFIAHALNRGARGVLVERRALSAATGVRAGLIRRRRAATTVIAVDSALAALGGPGPRLARPVHRAGGGDHRQLRQDHHQGDGSQGPVPDLSSAQEYPEPE